VMKDLTITYDGRELYSGPVIEMQWTESEQLVQVTGKIQKEMGFLEKLQLARQETAQVQENGGQTPAIEERKPRPVKPT